MANKYDNVGNFTKKPKLPTDYYDGYRNPEELKPKGAGRNPYDYMEIDEEGKDGQQDQTSASRELKRQIDLFDPELFPAQNSKKYSEKTGREFLNDFTTATRGQLIVCMSRLAQDNPKEFARIWIEMEKFNTPQQAAIDLNAQLSATANLYDKLDTMCEMPGEQKTEDNLLESSVELMEEETQDYEEVEELTEEENEQPINDETDGDEQ